MTASLSMVLLCPRHLSAAALQSLPSRRTQEQQQQQAQRPQQQRPQQQQQQQQSSVSMQQVQEQLQDLSKLLHVRSKELTSVHRWARHTEAAT